MRRAISTLLTAGLVIGLLLLLDNRITNAEELMRGIPNKEAVIDELRVFRPSPAVGPNQGQSPTVPIVAQPRANQSTTVTRSDRLQPPAPVEGPSVSVLIVFPFGSAELTPMAKQQLDAIAEALKSSDLQAFRFRVEGHTDAVGSDSYNLRLSKERAKAAYDYLTNAGGINASRLLAIGKGERELYNPREPYAEENRRVRIVTIGS